MFGLLQAALLLSTAIASVAVTALPTISVKGAKFFADGRQFFIKGVAYQGTPSDPLVDTTQCQLDAKAMQSIGTNSIRVYHANPLANHDGCMAAFRAAGIYIWLDLDTFNTTIVQTSPTWTREQFFAFAAVMDAFQHYDNLAGFWIGNEVINDPTGSPAAPYVKAAVADMKAYMSSQNYRTIPIGYSAADIAALRPMLQNYLVCGDGAQSIDFFGLNSYEWCGDSTYETSGYANLQRLAAGYPVPIFFSETGCNVPPQRTFGDQVAIFGREMAGTWSGSIIYEWVQETNDYGLVTYPGGQIYSGTPVPVQPDFDTLARVWRGIEMTGVREKDYRATLSAPPCPEASEGWGVDGDVPVPTLGRVVVMAAVAAAASSVKPSASEMAMSTSSGASSISASSSASASLSSTSILPTAPTATTSPQPSLAAAGVAATTTSKAAGSRVVVPVGILWMLGLMI
ncbi:1,3-beta-glucanosyltransferase [Lachnellula occidentalis]|uniref:1,3-beta-glucanosyltransferase n=1 Tax=Lachnellula occidentalis TaxID=215460 RepID=A0A8H8RJQ0_9HELO|nr:1,3-beta-glucanosyltransferase [Lachnellula occidentalis]